MNKKQGLTFEQHIELGRTLNEMRDLLIKATNLMQRGYGKTYWIRRYYIIDRNISEYKSQFENLMFDEHPEKADMEVYYGDKYRKQGAQHDQ